jgi:general secretion pathway protein N
MRGLQLVAMIVVMLLSALGSALVFAPASFIDLALNQATLGRVRLADTQGSIWQGSGRLVLAQAGDPQDDPAGPVLGGMAVPSRIGWELRVLPLMIGLVDASVTLSEGRPAVRISGNPTELRVGAGSLDLPSAQLSRLGSPWNTIRPSAALSMRWDSLIIREGVLDGRASIELRDTASAMTPVRPLGTYKIDVLGTGRDVSLSLSTLSGPLKLQGRGSWNVRGGLSFNGEAQAEGPQQLALQSLLSLVGQRSGDKTVLRIGG